MGVLVHLAAHDGAVVPRAELLDRVWGEANGSDEALSRAISLCRRAFSKLGVPDPIRTIARQGYALGAEVVRTCGLHAPVVASQAEARRLYLDGRMKSVRIANPSELAEAVSQLRRATELDPTFAPGWSALAHAQATAAGHTPFGDRLRAIRDAGESAARAIALDPRQPLANSVRAQVLLAERDICGAIEAAQTARMIAPEDAEAAMWLGYIFALLGLSKRALPLLETAVALDPLQGRRHMILAVASVAAGELAMAEKAARDAIAQGFFGGHEPLATAAFLRGDSLEAVSRFETALDDFSRVYAREPRLRSLLQFAARGFYGQSAVCRQLLLSAAVPLASVWMNKPEGLLAYIFLRTESPSRFFKSFGSRALPGNSIVLPYVWDASEGAAKVRASHEFDAFVSSLGMTQAWQAYGFPKR